MKITVKVLGGEDITLDVTPSTTILEIKCEIEKKLYKPLALQKLVFMGRTLNDEQTLSAYNIKDGYRMILIIIKPELSKDVMYRAFRKYYNEQLSMRLAKDFILEFHKKLEQLSLDDIERLAGNILSA